ncbi:MAG: HDOD domain-containing protein [Psychrosphaera sp.]|nr:HDOD domain-containing protein [Psychrosphaera sp.]
MCAATNQALNSLQAIESDFYEILFTLDDGDTPICSFDQSLLVNAELFLLSPEYQAEHMSMLPSILTRLISTIEDPQVDFIKVVTDLCDAPDVAREILTIANSDMYNAKGKDIRTIQHATSLIGLVSVGYIATTVLMSHVTRTKSSFFNSFSDIIHKHTIQTAMAGRDLAHQHDVNAFCSHVLGLIHNCGVVYSFNCLSNKLGESTQVKQPNPVLYQKVCRQWGDIMTVEIARKWAMPQIMIEALEQLRAPQAGLGKMLFLADLLSKTSLLVEHQKMTREAAIEVMTSHQLPQDYVENFLDMAKELE